MALTYTRAQIRTRCKERADMVNSNFISDSEWNSYIQASYGELWDLLVKANPDFYVREQTITGDGVTSDFKVPFDFYGTVGVDYRLESNQGAYSPLTRLFADERTFIDQETTGTPVGYRYVYNTAQPSRPKIRLLPRPDNGDVIRHTYVVAPTDLTTDNDEIDGVSGWEEYIVIDCAIKALGKEESSTTHLERQKIAMLERIEVMVENRTIDSFGRVVDSRSRKHIFDPADRFDMRKP